MEKEKPNRMIDQLLQLEDLLKEDLVWTNSMM